MTSEPCIVCGCNSELSRQQVDYFTCPRCGHYGVDISTRHAVEELSVAKRTALSRIIRLNQRKPGEDSFEFSEDIFDSLQPMTPYEQAENLIIFLGDNQQFKWHPLELKVALKNEMYALLGAFVEDPEGDYRFLS